MPKLGALAVVKAHPLVFGAVLAVAIGIVVYQLVKPKKHKKLKHSSRGPDDGDEGNDSPRQTEMLFYDPETKSLTADAPLSKSSNNNLRKRHVASDSPSKTKCEAKTEKKEAISEDVQTASVDVNKNIPSQTKETFSKEVQTESVEHNENIDNSKILPDKNIDSAMSVDEKIKEYFSKNIPGPDSADSNDETNSTYSNESDSTYSKDESAKKCNCECHSTENVDKLDSKNNNISLHKNNVSAKSVDANSSGSIVKPDQCVCNCECHYTQNDDESIRTTDSVSSSWSSISSTGINNINKPKTSRAPSICSAASIDSESSSFTVLSGDSELCRGCEINLVNTHTEPCNHRYMCADCAPRIYRLFKKCKICRTRIERIVVEE